MDRSMRTSEGFTLLELLIALALGSVILLTASNFLVNFAKFSSNVIKSEASLMTSTLSVFEEIADKISFANMAVCGNEAAMAVPGVARPGGCLTDGTCVQLRCATICTPGPCPNTPSIFSDDTVYNYWKSGTDLYRSICPSGVCGASSIIASNINTFSVYRVDNVNAVSAATQNTIRVEFGVETSSGATSGQQREYLDTTVVMREKAYT